MKIINVLSLVLLMLVLSINAVFAQSDSRDGGFFTEGAIITVTQLPDLLNDGIISVNYNGDGCPDCGTELTYDEDTKIFAGINSAKLEPADIASLNAAAASIYVDGNNKILTMRLFELPGSQ